MDIREILIDGISQLDDWMEEAIAPLTVEQLNFLPDGKTTSIGFNAWHYYRTADNITNFVLQRKDTIWMARDYMAKMELPKVAQGTGMGMEDARAVKISEPGVLKEYGALVMADVLAYIKATPEDELTPIQMIKPLGEMPRWRVIRQVLMTHGFMHLGEINAIRGTLGLQFSI